jgi:hypothetical protein
MQETASKSFEIWNQPPISFYTSLGAPSPGDRTIFRVTRSAQQRLAGMQ